MVIARNPTNFTATQFRQFYKRHSKDAIKCTSVPQTHRRSLRRDIRHRLSRRTLMSSNRSTGLASVSFESSERFCNSRFLIKVSHRDILSNFLPGFVHTAHARYRILSFPISGGTAGTVSFFSLFPLASFLCWCRYQILIRNIDVTASSEFMSREVGRKYVQGAAK